MNSCQSFQKWQVAIFICITQELPEYIKLSNLLIRYSYEKFTFVKAQ